MMVLCLSRNWHYQNCKKSRLFRKATLLEYYGYVYFFSFFLAGPAIDMRQYLEFIDMSMFIEKDKQGSKEKMNPTIPPGAYTAGFLSFCYAWVWAIGVVVQGYYPVDFCTTVAFGQLPFIHRVVYHWFSTFCVRTQYYTAWLLAEGGNVSIGLGFSGIRTRKSFSGGEYKVALWENASNVKALRVELSQNYREVTTSWNLGTENWLKRHIYARVKQSKKWQAYDVYATYFVSAVWHGFYPGYYLSFGFGALVTILARYVRRVCRPYFVQEGTPNGMTPKSTKIFYDILGTFCVNISMTYLFASFKTLSWESSMKMYKNLNFYGHIAVIALFILFYFLSRVPREQPPEITKKSS